MERNPYSPPQAAVSDQPADAPSIERPRQVIWAVWLLWTSLILGFLTLFFGFDLWAGMEEMDPGDLALTKGIVWAIMLGTTAAYLWLIELMKAGRNWARIVLLVFTILGIVSQLTPDGEYDSATWIAVSALDAFAQIAAMVLVFMKPASEWFKPRQAQR